MTDDKKTNDLLEAHFAAARDHAAEPSADLVARVIAAADQVQANRETEADARRTPPVATRGRLSSVFRVLGGWPAVAGLTAATLAGIWIGVNPPSALMQNVQVVLQTDDPYLIDVDLSSAFMGMEGAS